MIELQLNGHREWIEPGPEEALDERIARALPEGHSVCTVWVNGDETSASALAELEVDEVRELRVESALPARLAHDALDETRDWIVRISDVLRSIADDYRLGQTQTAAGSLAEVADALQVLIHLLGGIRRHLDLDDAIRSQIEAPWKEAEGALLESIDALSTELATGDPMVLADRTGHALPQQLGAFRELIEQVGGRGLESGA